MTALVLDAGALVAVDRQDRAMAARLRIAERTGFELRTNAMVVAQVWRDGRGRQARLARFLRSVDVVAVDQAQGRAAGEMLARTRTTDPVDATVALLAGAGDRILTGDPDDLNRLVATAGRRAIVVAC